MVLDATKKKIDAAKNKEMEILSKNEEEMKAEALAREKIAK